MIEAFGRRLLLLVLLWPGVSLGTEEALEGKLVIVGSDTLAELMTLWSAGFTALHPQVSVELQAGGSASAPIALTRGTANLGSMSRPMSAEERDRFVAERGSVPIEVPLAIDTIAMIVHQDNPLSVLSLDMIAEVFGHNACGSGQTARHWGDLGVTAPWSSLRIEPFGRTLASGTYDLFRNIALCGGDPSARVGESPGNASMLETVANTPGAIGYVGIGFVDERVRVPALDTGDGLPIPLSQMATDPRYPFNRTLYLYLG